MYKIILCVFIAFLVSNEASDRWPDHDISTLKLLQIVHRHGNRNPGHLTANDPFKDPKYWVEGMEELTTKGKYRMYKLGEFIRQEYNQYLGDKYSPREVYVRSSILDRCIESTSCLLAGAYPPKQKDWEWNNGTDAQLGLVWQPFPIQTFMPIDNDTVCVVKDCLAVTKERERIFNQTFIKEKFAQFVPLFKNLSKISGHPIVSPNDALVFRDALDIELSHNLVWSKTWTLEEEKHIVDQLLEPILFYWRYNWDSRVIQRFTAGGLVRELNDNYKRVLDKSNNKKLYVYSTHDTQLEALMYSFNISNHLMVPFGSALLFELHQNNKTNDYFVRAFYQNETTINEGIPHSLQWGDCDRLADCPLNRYINFTKDLLYEDFDKECANI